MTAVVAFKGNIPSLQMDEAELVSVLSNSLYPGAKAESIKLAIGYCRAAGLDPLQKPVHIVPMSVKTGHKKNNGDDEYQMRDVIMPGIGLYRIQAARTGEYAGMSDPEFGPDKTMSLGKDQERAEYTFPEWCRVTVKRIVEGRVVEFTAIEYWIENYATAGKWTTAPNAMWKKRPRGQLAKCAEAQALRKAFPELGAQPTADELEGKVIDAEGAVVVEDRPRVEQPKLVHHQSGAPAAEHAQSTADTGNASSGAASDQQPFKAMIPQQKRMLEARLKSAGLSKLDLKTKFNKDLDATDESGFAFSDYNDLEKWVRENAKA
jgi:phage recombination protein Bet